ncbi:MAG: hypothetical protein CVV51_12585 [Spirochaetae bacterium HGW-Spirochaetae-7]|jgi:hypothetical protein|nr:MAG: hypothetical protein CVV51_12585 [Spirochaetae bacterium HGW-Spirochaetae-7]
MNERTFHTAKLAALLASVAMLSSCQQFFTTSLAALLARDSYNIPSDMSISDATEWLAIAKRDNNEKLAAALVTPLLALATAADPAGAAYDEAASALVTAVLISSGASPAIIGILKDIGTQSFDSLTGPQIDSALGSLMAISLSTEEATALLLIAANGAPDGLSSDDLYVAALSLAIDAFGDAGVAITSFADLAILLDTGTNPAAVDDASINGAIALLIMAQTLDAVDSSDSILGQLLSGLAFE